MLLAVIIHDVHVLMGTLEPQKCRLEFKFCVKVNDLYYLNLQTLSSKLHITRYALIFYEIR